MLTVQSSPYKLTWKSPYMLTWRPYDDMTVDDVAVLYWQIWANDILPRGTPLLAYGLLVQNYGVRGIRTPDLPHQSKLW
jgi:hypothetical protein